MPECSVKSPPKAKASTSVSLLQQISVYLPQSVLFLTLSFSVLSDCNFNSVSLTDSDSGAQVLPILPHTMRLITTFICSSNFESICNRPCRFLEHRLQTASTRPKLVQNEVTSVLNLIGGYGISWSWVQTRSSSRSEADNLNQLEPCLKSFSLGIGRAAPRKLGTRPHMGIGSCRLRHCLTTSRDV